VRRPTGVRRSMSREHSPSTWAHNGQLRRRLASGPARAATADVYAASCGRVVVATPRRCTAQWSATARIGLRGIPTTMACTCGLNGVVEADTEVPRIRRSA